MKSLITGTFIAILVIASTGANAQGKKFKVGLGLEAALPVGNLGTVYSVGAGLSLRFLYKITPKFGATFTTGGIAFIPKGGINKSSKASLNIPFKVGGRYKFTDKFYGIMEIGDTHSIVYFDDTNNSVAHVSGDSFTYAPGVGLLLGGFDVSLRYEGYQSAGFLGLRLGFFF